MDRGKRRLLIVVGKLNIAGRDLDHVRPAPISASLGRGDVDAKRFETVDRKTRFVPREERTRAFDWDRSADHIRARSHNGCIQRPDTWLHPNVSRTRQILFPCTAGAVHTWHQAA